MSVKDNNAISHRDFMKLGLAVEARPVISQPLSCHAVLIVIQSPLFLNS